MNTNKKNDAKSRNIILKSYLFFAAIVFSGTAAVKLLSDFSFSDVELRSYDPFLRFLTAGQLMVLVALLEIGVVVYVLFNFFRRPVFALRSVMWLSSLFACYRIGFAFAPFGRRKLQMLGSRLAVGKDGRFCGGLGKHDSIGDNANDWRRFDVVDPKESSYNPPEAGHQQQKIKRNACIGFVSLDLLQSE